MEVQIHRDVGERGHQRHRALRGAAEAGHDEAALAAADREGRDEEEIKVRDHVKKKGVDRIRPVISPKYDDFISPSLQYMGI